MMDNIFCPHCGMGFTNTTDYLEHIRCYVQAQTESTSGHSALTPKQNEDEQEAQK